MTTNRSSEELTMRAIIVPKLREQYPTARIIHELPLRYSTNRIDLAAVTESKIVAVEIKSSKDVADRLEAQLRGFLPVAARVIVALAPKWNVELPMLVTQPKPGHTRHTPQYTAAQEAINRVGSYGAMDIWTVNADAKSVDVTRASYRDSMPWHAKMLDMLHVSELVEIASQHRCWQRKRPVHLDLVTACNELMTGREIIASVCGALRKRAAFAKESDQPHAA